MCASPMANTITAGHFRSTLQEITLRKIDRLSLFFNRAEDCFRFFIQFWLNDWLISLFFSYTSNAPQFYHTNIAYQYTFPVSPTSFPFPASYTRYARAVYSRSLSIISLSRRAELGKIDRWFCEPFAAAAPQFRVHLRSRCSSDQLLVFSLSLVRMRKADAVSRILRCALKARRLMPKKFQPINIVLVRFGFFCVWELASLRWVWT